MLMPQNELECSLGLSSDGSGTPQRMIGRPNRSEKIGMSVPRENVPYWIKRTSTRSAAKRAANASASSSVTVSSGL